MEHYGSISFCILSDFFVYIVCVLVVCASSCIDTAAIFICIAFLLSFSCFFNKLCQNIYCLYSSLQNVFQVINTLHVKHCLVYPRRKGTTAHLRPGQNTLPIWASQSSPTYKDCRGGAHLGPRGRTHMGLTRASPSGTHLGPI